MNRIFKILMLFSFIFSVGSAQAALSSQSVDAAGFSNLSETEKAQVIANITAMNKGKVANESVINEIDKWAEVGTKLGKGLGAAAKELGVAVSEFSQTPIGKVVTFSILWSIFSEQLIGTITGILIWILSILIITWYARRYNPPKLEYSNEKTNIFGNYVITKKVHNSMDGDAVAGFIAIQFIMLVIGGIFIVASN